MEAVTLVKCGHPLCHCLVEKEQGFCGPACSNGADETAEKARTTEAASAPCKCGHPECSAGKKFQEEIAETLKLD
jgi:hypothetical protein